MRFNIYREARLSLIILSLILTICVIFCLVASMFTSMGYKGLMTSTNMDKTLSHSMPVIIIDAGHGGEDPGAVANGLVEKYLNLEIAKMINEMLKANGYKTHLTRVDDRLLYNIGEENRKKHFDIRNRIKIASEFNEAVFVSVHMNKFPAEYCKGLQTFYNNENESGKLLAELIQKNVRKLQTDNHRVIADGKESIYLLEKLEIPATLIECGFLSNSEEANLLNNDNYKLSLTMSIYCGIADFMEYVK